MRYERFCSAIPLNSFRLLPPSQQLTNSRLRYRLTIDKDSAQIILQKMMDLKLIRLSEESEDGSGERVYEVIRAELESFMKSVAKKMRQVMVRIKVVQVITQLVVQVVEQVRMRMHLWSELCSTCSYKV